MDKPIFKKSYAEDRLKPGLKLWAEVKDEYKLVYYVASVDEFRVAYTKLPHAKFVEVASMTSPARVYFALSSDANVEALVKEVYRALSSKPTYVVLPDHRVVFDVALKNHQQVARFAGYVQGHGVGGLDMDVYKHKRVPVASDSSKLSSTLIFMPMTVTAWTAGRKRARVEEAEEDEITEALAEDLAIVEKWLAARCLAMTEPRIVNGEFWCKVVNNVVCERMGSVHPCELKINPETHLGRWDCSKCKGVVWGCAEIVLPSTKKGE